MVSGHSARGAWSRQQVGAELQPAVRLHKRSPVHRRAAASPLPFPSLAPTSHVPGAALHGTVTLPFPGSSWQHLGADTLSSAVILERQSISQPINPCS